MNFRSTSSSRKFKRTADDNNNNNNNSIHRPPTIEGVGDKRRTRENPSNPPSTADLKSSSLSSQHPPLFGVYKNRIFFIVGVGSDDRKGLVQTLRQLKRKRCNTTEEKTLCEIKFIIFNVFFPPSRIPIGQ
jgi:hypothetical protein